MYLYCNHPRCRSGLAGDSTADHRGPVRILFLYKTLQATSTKLFLDPVVRCCPLLHRSPQGCSQLLPLLLWALAYLELPLDIVCLVPLLRSPLEVPIRGYSDTLLLVPRLNPLTNICRAVLHTLWTWMTFQEDIHWRK